MKNFMIGQYGGIRSLSFWIIASTGVNGAFMIRETMYGSMSTQKQSFDIAVSSCLRGWLRKARSFTSRQSLNSMHSTDMCMRLNF